MLKKDGKQWTHIAETIGTKNEQQCRTRGLVLFNKLKKHCWDKELFDVLAPNGKYSYRDVPREKKCKTLRVGNLKKEVKTEDCSDRDTESNTNETGGLSFTKLLNGDTSKVGIQNAAIHREKVKKIKEEYRRKKQEAREAERLAREKRKQLIRDTKAKIK